MRLTMARPGLDWTDELERWLEPFLDVLGHSTRRMNVPGLRGWANRPW